MRIGGDEMRVGVDANGIVATFDETIERLILVFITRARPAAFEPGKISHGDGPQIDLLFVSFRVFRGR
ncbi:hypothetical protein OPIT5_07615 [Opitutaceae bacterium TAV5]|nr:hypothetical protein OPIT5_07615 [Opitutaceae bacterium TAV5]